MSEDPVPYRCGNEHEPHTRRLKFDGNLTSVLTWRVVGSIGGDSLSWRFITAAGGTVAVRPVQLPSNAAGPFCVPTAIRSAMGSVSWLIDLAHGRYGIKGAPQEPDYPSIATTAGEKCNHTARNEWYGKRADLHKRAKTVDPAPWRDAFNRTLAEEAARFWPSLYAQADDAKKQELAASYIASIPAETYTKRLCKHVTQDLFQQYAPAHAGLLQRVHAETEAQNHASEAACNAARMAHDSLCKRFYREVALYEINAFLGRTTRKKPVAIRDPGKRGGYTATERAAIVKRLTDPKGPAAAKLEAIRAFILQKLFKPYVPEIVKAPEGKPIPADPKTWPPSRGPIRDTDLRRLVQFIGEQLGQDMTLPILLAYHSAMPAMFKGWASETVKARKIQPSEAEQFLAQHVTFIAECEGRQFPHCYPIEDISAEPDVTNQEDRAPYQVLIRRESEMDQPREHHGSGVKSRKGGRPVHYDQKRDAATHKQWVDMKAAGTVGTHAEFASELNLPCQEVNATLDRARHRRARQTLSRNK